MPAPVPSASLALAALLLAAGVCARAENVCPDPAGPVALGSAQWNGWGRDLDNTRYQPEPAIRAADVPKLALKWAFGYQGSAVAGQPTIVDGRVFVASATGHVYSLDAKTGCTYWTFDAQTGVRTAVTIGELAAPKAAPRPKKSKHSKRTPAHLEVQKAPSAVFFGDDRGAVYALDAQKGRLLWKTQVEGQPSARIVGAPTLYQNRLYVAVASGELSSAADVMYPCCTFRGSVTALDIATGDVQWKSYTVNAEPRPLQSASGSQRFGPAGVPVMASPTIDTVRGLLYIATGSSFTPIDQPLADAVVAFDLADGKLRWSRQPAAQGAGPAEFFGSPILRTLASGKQVILAGQRSGIVYALDPDRAGEILWQTKVSAGNAPGGVEWGPAADHHSLYVALSGLTADPQNLSGSLTALDIKTGAIRWQTQAPTPACSWGQECPHAQAQAVTVIPGIAFSGSMDGHLRAYSTIDGKILWDYETATDFATVNGVKASGGTLDQGGATIVNGVLYINSGYGQSIGQPGNVLLAFSVAGKKD